MSSPQQQMSHPPPPPPQPLQPQPHPQPPPPPAECSGLPVSEDVDPQEEWYANTVLFHCEICGECTDHHLVTGVFDGRGCYVGYCPDEETRKNEAEEATRRAGLTEFERVKEDRDEFPRDGDERYY